MTGRTSPTRVVAGILAALALALAPSLAGAQSPPSPMSILYVTDAGAFNILFESKSMRELPWLFRQEPTSSRGSAALSSTDQRMTKMSGAALFRQKSTAAMRNMLKAAVDRTCITPAGVNTCGAGIVGVDELGTEWGVPAGEDRSYPRKAVYLSAAMDSLALMPHPGGGSYADRIHFYIAPGVSTAISAGRGPDRVLGRDGKKRFRNYSTLARGMARAGGLWIEMYHYPARGSGRTPFLLGEWVAVPEDFAQFLNEKTLSSTGRDAVQRMHFVMTETGTRPKGCPPGDEISCQWYFASLTATNRTILNNGPAAFKLTGMRAYQWGFFFRVHFRVSET